MSETVIATERQSGRLASDVGGSRTMRSEPCDLMGYRRRMTSEIRLSGSGLKLLLDPHHWCPRGQLPTGQ